MSYSSNRVDDSEDIARLLLHPQMIKNGKPKPSVFPVDELLAKKGKNGSSVDRCRYLPDRDKLLKSKAEEIANPSANRNPYGFFVSTASDIRKIKFDTESKQAFEIWPDKIVRDKGPSKPWDDAHALLRGFDNCSTPGKIRGVRDKLIGLFSQQIVRFDS